jgi:hypothetical protein
VPVLTPVLSTRFQTAVPESPESAECASAPNATTPVEVAGAVIGVLVLQAVPEVGEVQV